MTTQEHESASTNGAESRNLTPGSTPPLAPPTPHRSETASTQVTGASGALRGTNTSPSKSAPSSSTVGRVGPRRRVLIREQASERDLSVLHMTQRHRYLTTAHIEKLAFTGHASQRTAARAARSVLARLERDRLLRALDRRVGGLSGGSSATVWQLAPGGARLLHDGVSHYRTHVPTIRFLEHTLAVADAHLAVRSAAIALSGTSQVQIEHEATRRYMGLGGGSLYLRPDLYADVHGSDDQGAFDDRWFVEVDMGTESIPTLIRKCQQYETYRNSGIEEADAERTGDAGRFPLVLWVFHGRTAEARLGELRRRIGRSSSLTTGLYRFTTAGTLDELLRSGG